MVWNIMGNHQSLSKTEIIGTKWKCATIYPVKPWLWCLHIHLSMKNIYDQNYWTLDSGYNRLISKLLLLFNKKLPNIIGKHCSRENISHLWKNNLFATALLLSFILRAGGGGGGQECNLDYPDTRFHIVPQAGFQHFVAGKNMYSSSKLFAYGVLCVFSFCFCFLANAKVILEAARRLLYLKMTVNL